VKKTRREGRRSFISRTFGPALNGASVAASASRHLNPARLRAR